MNDLIDKVENLKEALNDTKQVKEIKDINKLIMNDKELLELIKKYNETQDEDIKTKILNNELFKDYKDKETELNILILEINSKLKEISNKGKCCWWKLLVVNIKEEY